MASPIKDAGKAAERDGFLALFVQQAQMFGSKDDHGKRVVHTGAQVAAPFWGVEEVSHCVPPPEEDFPRMGGAYQASPDGLPAARSSPLVRG